MTSKLQVTEPRVGDSYIDSEGRLFEVVQVERDGTITLRFLDGATIECDRSSWPLHAWMALSPAREGNWDEDLTLLYEEDLQTSDHFDDIYLGEL